MGSLFSNSLSLEEGGVKSPSTVSATLVGNRQSLRHELVTLAVRPEQ
jgi:hypothetical protein